MAEQVMHPGNLRLAMRVEGVWWIAYAAPMNTMDGAVRLGSIGMAAVQRGKGGARRKLAFMDLMKDVLTEFLTDAGATPTHWNEPVTAPERERAGRA